MNPLESRHGLPPAGKVFGLLLTVAIAVLCAWWWWSCRHDSSVPFLPASAPAEWIVYSKAPDASPHRATPLFGEFRRSWTLSSKPSVAELSARVFRQGALRINGQAVVELHLDPIDWKKIRSVDVSKYLRAGDNEISVTVTNAMGPPALWLALDANGTMLRSDDEWQVSYVGAMWLKAQLAAAPPIIRPGSILFGRELVVQSLRRTWLVVLVFLVAACGVVFLVDRNRPPTAAMASIHPRKWLSWENGPVIVLALILISWVILFSNNLPLIAPLLGFDRDGHLEYIDYILQKGSLPLADKGWQMYQPPLFYALSALLVVPMGGAATADSAVLGLRVFSMCTGMALVTMVFLCLRLVFPNRPAQQIVGLLVAGFLPPTLYLSHNITNEVLAALFLTLALYFTLLILRGGRNSRRWLIATGASLGLAMLTKFSALLAIPFILGAVAWPRGQEKPVRSAVNSVGIVAATFLLVCGWHFARVWVRFGTPLIGNWDPRLSFAWWQDPGYHTAGWYTMFGDALICPLFSSITSFGDGIYSTLWGDGLCSGSATMNFRPQWNYDLMNWAYVLALPATLLIVAGAVISVVRFLRRPTPEFFLLVGLAFAFATGITLMSLKVSSHAQVKAFYGLSALLPLCVLMIVGWDFLESIIPKLRLALWIGLLAWVMTVFGAFWIQSGKPFTYTVRGVGYEDDSRFADAAREFSRALELDPTSLQGRAGLANALNDLGRKDDALDQVALVLKQHPRDGQALLKSAILLGVNHLDEKAIPQFEEGLRLEPDDPIAYAQLAGSLARANRFAEMRETCEHGLRVDPFNPDLHRLLAAASGELGDPTNAATHFEIALQLRPNWAAAQGSLALALVSMGRLDEAIELYRKAVEARPSDSMLRFQFAVALAMQGNARGAAEQYYQVLATQPDHVGALNNLAWILAANPNADIRNGTEAVRLASHACELSPNPQPVLLGTLAAAYAEAGRFPEAIATAEKARDAAIAAGQKDVADTNSQLIDLYRSGKPLREPSPKTGH